MESVLCSRYYISFYYMQIFHLGTADVMQEFVPCPSALLQCEGLKVPSLGQGVPGTAGSLTWAWSLTSHVFMSHPFPALQEKLLALYHRSFSVSP